MKICAVVPGFYRHDGVAYVARHLTTALADRGVDCWIVTDSGRDGDVAFDPGPCVEIRTVAEPALPFPIDVFGYAARAAPTIRRLHRRHGFDLVHAHGHHLLAAGLFDQLRVVGAPLLATAHGTYRNELVAFEAYPAFEGQWRYRTGVRLDQRILAYGCGRADRIHAVASQTADELRTMGFDPADIDVVPNGVDLKEFDRERDDLPQVRDENDLGAAPLVVSVGSVVPRKGVHDLAAAAVALRDRRPRARVVHVGGVGHPGYADVVEELAAGTNGAMSLTGRVSRQALLGWLDAADVYASASYSEGCPISLLEAAASATTTVATDIGGSRDVLGDHGRYVDPSDSAALAAALDEALDDPGAGRRLRRRVGSAFRWPDLAGELLESYRRCAA